MKRLYTDLLRVGFLLVVSGGILYWLDPANVVVFQALLIAVFVAGGTHLTRRIMLPRMDLQSIATDAAANNKLAPAIVFAAIIALIIAVMFLSMSVLK